ncbi:MAG: hypothetical protein ACYDFS_02500, partial [Vulcanimicrobiaceae bacterium]
MDHAILLAGNARKLLNPALAKTEPLRKLKRASSEQVFATVRTPKRRRPTEDDFDETMEDIRLRCVRV